MNQRGPELIVIGTSAGGVEALSKLVSQLPSDFHAAILIAMHTSTGESQLPRILARKGKLRVIHADDGVKIEQGTVYVARPNSHLMVEDGRLRSTLGPRRNGHRPSINALFESAAQEWGPRVTGVILSGALDDGTLGLLRIKQAGGKAFVQSPEDALFTGMPQSALDNVSVDFCGTVAEIAFQLTQATDSSASEGRRVSSVHLPDRPEREESNQTPGDTSKNPDEVAGLVCPECGGVLREERFGDVIRFRCHVGHELTERAMLNAQGEEVERALWTALRILEERSYLVGRAAIRARERGNTHIVDHFEAQNREAQAKAEILRSVLFGDGRQQSIAALQGNGDATIEHHDVDTLEPVNDE